MKLTGSLFPFVFATSWLGNILLTGLGFFLAFTQAEPLTIGLFVTAALCILSGNSLPLAAYALFLYAQRLRLLAEQTQASGTVRDVVRRSETVLQRLEAAEGAIAKSLLLARQLPETFLQTQGAQEALLQAMAAFDSDAVSALAERLEEVKEARADEENSFQLRLEPLEASVAAVRAALSAMEERLAALAESQRGPEIAEETSLLERFDLLQEAVEGIEHTLDGLLLMVGSKPEEKASGEAIAPAPEPANDTDNFAEEAPEPPVILDPAEGLAASLEASDESPAETASGGEDAVEKSVLRDPADEASAAMEAEPLLEVRTEEVAEVSPAPPKREKGPRKVSPSDRVAPSSQFEMGFEGPSEAESVRVRPDQVIIRVKSMVGIQNKLYIRGDEPHLSWEAGQRMDVVGIGEFFIEFHGVSEAFGAAFWLNDDVEAESGPVRLEPGQRYDLAVRFRR